MVLEGSSMFFHVCVISVLEPFAKNRTEEPPSRNVSLWWLSPRMMGSAASGVSFGFIITPTSLSQCVRFSILV